MKSLRSYIPLLIFGAIAIFISLLPLNSYAQCKIFLNKSNNGAFNLIPSGISAFDVRIGETFYIDVWFDIASTSITGISTFITFDENFFEIIDQDQTPNIRPFIVTGGFSAFSNHTGNMVEEPNAIPGYQISIYSQMPSGSTIEETGRIARFALKAIGVTGGSEITIDYDRGNHRDTRMHFLNLTSRKFDVRGSATVGVLGVNLQGIPDVLMEPGQTLANYFDLDDFLYSPPEDSLNLGWSVSGTQDSVIVTIHPTSHDVTFRAIGEFTGFRDFVFNVSDPQGPSDSETMRVYVTYFPEFKDNINDSIVFNEDEVYTMFLDTLAHDSDDDSTTLSWSGYSTNENIIVAIDDSVTRTLSIQGTKDYFGSGEVVFIITDPQGATDSLQVGVTILPINDPPVISGLPDVHLLPGQVDSSIVLKDYTHDVDSPIGSINYTWTGELNVTVFMDMNTTRLIISGISGFTGTETIIFRAYEINPDFATFDTMKVTVGPKPPVFIALLPDTVIYSSNVVTTVRYVDLDDYVIDDDDLVSDLIWSASGSRLSVNIGADHVAHFVVPARMHGIDNVIFTVTDRAGASARDTVKVLVFDNGRPLIYGLPELLYIPVGGDTALTLDDYVIDNDTPKENLTWSVSGNQNITINIESSSPHTVIIASPNEAFTGQEIVTFTVKDPENNIDTHPMIIQPISPGEPIVSDIPDIEITRNRPGTLDLDDYVFIFPLSDRSNIQWSVTPSADAKVNVSINPSTNVATFTVIDQDFKGSRSFTFTATNIVNGLSESDPMTVTVTFGKEPILGHLPDVEFITGDTSEAINLNKYVFDADTPDDLLLWEIQSFNILAVEENLERGANHLLILTARQGFVGVEFIILTAIDPEGNSDSDTMRVYVKSSATLELKIVSNPVSADYIDIVVFATDTLVGTPAVSLEINGQTVNIDVHKIGNEFIWKADYIFEAEQTGTVKILAVAADNFGSTIKDSTTFTLGLLSKAEGYTYSDRWINLSFPANFVQKDKKIIVMPDERQKYFRWLIQDKDFPETLEEPVQSYYIGGGMDEDTMLKNGNLSFDYRYLGLPPDELQKYGIYYIRENTSGIQFISNHLDPENQIIQAEINRFGLYFVAADIHAPEVFSIDSFDAKNVRLNVRIFENESGIESFQTEIDSREYNNTVVNLDNDMYEITVENFEQSGSFTLFFSVTDRAGNISQTVEIQFKREVVPEPETYMLFQNYPNPFNPATKIRYRLPKDDNVTLTIYNTAGQKVRTLINQRQPAGIYTVEWDSRNDMGIQVSTGVYVYVFKTGHFIKVLKMAFIK